MAGEPPNLAESRPDERERADFLSKDCFGNEVLDFVHSHWMTWKKQAMPSFSFSYTEATGSCLVDLPVFMSSCMEYYLQT